MSAKSSIVDPKAVVARVGSTYPKPFDEAVRGREKRALGDAAGLTRLGVNLTRLAPGSVSSQRHWHTCEDEFVYVLEGELVLIEDRGETVLSAGMGAGFPAGRPNGHQLLNRSMRDAVYLEIGNRDPADGAEYPDIDLRVPPGRPRRFLRKDGTAY